MAELHREKGSKYITLINRLGLSRATVRATVDAAIDAGWVMRNPGYGHPLRPEYILTDVGRSLGPPCERLLAKFDDLDLPEVAQRKWSMPVLFVLRGGARRFGDLRGALPGITDRALTLALKDLVAADLVVREVSGEYPPTPVYRLNPLTKPLLRELRALARALVV